MFLKSGNDIINYNSSSHLIGFSRKRTDSRAEIFEFNFKYYIKVSREDFCEFHINFYKWKGKKTEFILYDQDITKEVKLPKKLFWNKEAFLIPKVEILFFLDKKEDPSKAIYYILVSQKDLEEKSKIEKYKLQISLNKYIVKWQECQEWFKRLKEKELKIKIDL